MLLGNDLAKAWNSPSATIETRKKIIRLLVKEIIVDVVDDKLALVIHWQGGDHTEMTVKKNKIGQTLGRSTPMSSILCGYWRGNCRIWQLPRS